MEIVNLLSIGKIVKKPFTRVSDDFSATFCFPVLMSDNSVIFDVRMTDCRVMRDLDEQVFLDPGLSLTIGR